MSDFVLSNGLVNHEVAFRIVVAAGIVISVLLAVGLHFSILQEAVKLSFFVFISQNSQTQVISHHSFGLVW
jgi:heme/copper-type cytochrome/quinol oxidase subunit 4